MARNSETVAGAISAVNAIVSSQAAALAELKALVQTKAAGANLADVEIFVGDLTDSTSYTITKGAVDGYKRTIIS